MPPFPRRPAGHDSRKRGIFNQLLYVGDGSKAVNPQFDQIGPRFGRRRDIALGLGEVFHEDGYAKMGH